MSADEVRAAAPALLDALHAWGRMSHDERAQVMGDMRRLDPEYDRTLALVRRTHEAARKILGKGSVKEEAPEWFLLSAVEAVLLYTAGEAETCGHLDGDSVGYAVMARPGRISCLECGPSFFDLSPEEDKRCDFCGHVCTQQEDDPLFIGSMAIGPLVYTVGICARCK